MALNRIDEGGTPAWNSAFRVLPSAFAFEGRWTSPDPLGGDITNPQSLNRYAYALNNPTSNTDPSGLCDPSDPFCFTSGGGGCDPIFGCCDPGDITCGPPFPFPPIIIFGGGGDTIPLPSCKRKPKQQLKKKSHPRALSSWRLLKPK